MISSLLAALAIAFPADGAKLPAVKRCYFLGSVDPGVATVAVQGTDVAVHPKGGWVTMVDLVEGENAIVATAGELSVTTRVTVAKRPAASASPMPAKPYEKLPYAADRPKAGRTGIVFIDPGHGGGAPGTMAPHGRPEKEVNLQLAKAVRDELARLGYRVYMTREDDRDLSLEERPRLAHRLKADAFVSIHHNAPGFETDPRKVRYHTVYAWNELGEKLAKPINARMVEVLGESLRSNGVMHGNFTVMRSPEIPSCLVETDFITTPEGEDDAWNPSRQAKIAVAIACGIADALSD